MKYALKILCIVLMLASMAVLLFLPCWTVEDESVSAAEYILAPSEYRTLTKELREITDSKKLVTRNALPIMVLLMGSAAGAVFGMIKIKKRLPEICAILVGFVGIFVYLTNKMIKTGKIGLLGLILSTIVLLAGIATLVHSQISKKGE